MAMEINAFVKTVVFFADNNLPLGKFESFFKTICQADSEKLKELSAHMRYNSKEESFFFCEQRNEGCMADIYERICELWEFVEFNLPPQPNSMEEFKIYSHLNSEEKFLQMSLSDMCYGCYRSMHIALTFLSPFELFNFLKHIGGEAYVLKKPGFHGTP